MKTVNHIFALMLIALFSALSASCGVSEASNGGESSPHGGAWSIGPPTVVVSGVPAGLCTVEHADGVAVKVTVKNAEGIEVNSQTLRAGNSTTVGVPEGGSVTIERVGGSGGAHGSYTYTVSGVYE